MVHKTRLKVTASFGDDSLPRLDDSVLLKYGLVEAVTSAIESFESRRALVERFGDDIPTVLPDPVIKEIDSEELRAAVKEIGLGEELPLRFSYKNYSILISVEAGCG
ncbi:MAG: hypothetical protein NZ988_02665 [Thaumarchaeota archaeon]|nr:hypothetical protein [Candidatus Calditenuaceae archaeon]MDW8186936.1 hypothetical protein [Nitrososphaerota archaeon]